MDGINSKNKQLIWLVLGACTFFILSVSFFQSIWLDEGLSIEFSKQSIKEILNISMSTDLHPPLYNLWLKFSGVLFGQSIFAYRFWSAAFYFLTGYILFKHLYSKESKVGRIVLGTVFFLLSPFAVYYASEARSYMAVILISLLQYLSFEKICSGEDIRKNQIVYILTSVIGSYLFYPLIFNLIAQFIYIIILKRNLFKNFIISWLIIGFLYLPWIYLVVAKRVSEAPGHFLAIPWWQIPAIIFVGFSGGRVGITDLNHVRWYWPTLIVSSVYALNFVGLWYAWKKTEERENLIRLIFVFSVPILVCLLISAFRFSIFDPRYYASVFILFTLLLVKSHFGLSEVKPRLAKVFVWSLIAVNLLAIGLYVFNPLFQREQWKKWVAVLEWELQPNDAVLFIGYNQPPPTYTAYQQKQVKIISTYPSTLKNTEEYGAIEQHLKNETNGMQRVWYSQFLEWQKDPEQKIRKIIEKEFKYVKTIGFFKVQFDLYERK